MKIEESPSILDHIEAGMEKEIETEIKVWNERLFKTPEYKGTSLDRFPLSPSQGGRCSLALARDVSHVVGRGDYPKHRADFNYRVQRVFARGHLLESAMVEDIEKYTPYKITEKQTRLRIFPIGTDPETGEEVWCEGNSDGLAVHGDSKILLDFKSKGARYSANFSDTIQEMFQELRKTGLVMEVRENEFAITDIKKLFDVLPLSDFLVDYLLQLNAYAFGFRNAGTKVDFVGLFYENKNTEAYYIIKWIPNVALLDFMKKKYQYIWDMVMQGKHEEVPKEFTYGTARCFLCKYKGQCYGEDNLKTSSDPAKTTETGNLTSTLDKAFTAGLQEEGIIQKVHEEVLTYMQQNDLRYIRLGNGLKFERKHLKSPKPHYELRQVKG
jgi:hypothetical protein